MSRKNRDPRITSTTDGDRQLHAVADAPDQLYAPTTEDKVREALTGNPGATTAVLAMAAGVGRSTAAKILVRWGRDGAAIRTAGDGPRNPDTWTLAPSDHDAAAPSTEARSDTTASDAADHTDPVNDTAPDADGATVANTTAVQETVSSDTDDGAESPATDTTNDKAGSAAGADVENRTSPLPDTTPGIPADSATTTGLSAVTDTIDTDTAATDKDRLPKGGLRAVVEEYLTDHPGESFGPAKIGKVLGRSGGAVNNALEKLVADGYAIKTCEAPKRFAINPDKTDVPATSDDTEPALEA